LPQTATSQAEAAVKQLTSGQFDAVEAQFTDPSVAEDMAAWMKSQR
jgi:hypothetical protein